MTDTPTPTSADVIEGMREARRSIAQQLHAFYQLAQNSDVDVNGAPRDRSRWTFKAWRCEDVDTLIELAEQALALPDFKSDNQGGA